MSEQQEPKQASVDNAEISSPKQKKRKSRKGLIFLLTICIILGGYYTYNSLVSVPIALLPETCLIEDLPLLPEGQGVDFSAYLLAKIDKNKMISDDNAVRAIVQNLNLGYDRPSSNIPADATPEAVAAREKLAEEFQNAFLKELYINLEKKPTRFLHSYLVGYGDYLSEKEVADQIVLQDRFSFMSLDNTPVVSWTKNELDFAQEWMNENSETIDFVVQNLNKESFLFPYLLGKNIETLDQTGGTAGEFLITAQNWQRILKVRANMRIIQGNISGALDDLTAICRLGGFLIRNEPQLYLPMKTGSMMLRLFWATAVDSNPNAPLKKEDWERLYLANQFLMPVHSDQSLFQNEQLLELARIQNEALRAGMSTNGENNADSEIEQENGLLVKMPKSVDWNLVAKRFNAFVENPSLLNRNNPDSFSPWQLVFNSLTRRQRSMQIAEKRAEKFVDELLVNKDIFYADECLKQTADILYAMQMYLADHQTLPPAFTVDGNGKPLHSWRVFLLPYLGQKELFDKIRLDEPWDSEHNKQFHSMKTPFSAFCDASSAKNSSNKDNSDKNIADDNIFGSSEVLPGTTFFAVIAGENVLFRTDGQGVDPVDFQKAHPDIDIKPMILVAESNVGVNWMKPNAEILENNAGSIDKSLSGELEQNGRKLGSVHRDGMTLGLLNGSVLFFSKFSRADEFEHHLFGKDYEKEVVPGSRTLLIPSSRSIFDEMTDFSTTEQTEQEEVSSALFDENVFGDEDSDADSSNSDIQPEDSDADLSNLNVQPEDSDADSNNLNVQPEDSEADLSNSDLN